MRLSKILIRNFKAIRDIELTIPATDPRREGSADFLSIVGENNSSKSSVLEALKIALPTGQNRPTLDQFRDQIEENGPIEVEFHFEDLTEHDETEQGIRTHVFEGEYKVKKVWESENSPPTIWAFQPEFDYPSWPDPDTRIANFRDLGDDWDELLAAYEEEIGQIPGRVSAAFREDLRDLAIRRESPLAVEREARWVQNPGGFSAHVDSILPLPIYIPAIKETKTEADVTQKKSAIRQIVEVMFSRELATNPAVQSFTRAGEDVKRLFEGEEGDEIVRRIESRIGNGIKRFIDLDAALEFEPPDLRTELASKTSLHLVEGGLQTKPEHQGHGAQRALVLSLLEILSEDSLADREGEFLRGLLLLIEEPEIYMHPQMCRKMRDVLLSIAKSGTAQVICTTHSPVFLDLADRHDGIAIFRRGADNVQVVQRIDDLFGDDGGENNRARLRMLLDFDPAVNEVFFAQEVCLVEGDSEIAALDALARRMVELEILEWPLYLLTRRDLVIVNCRGKWTIRAFQRVLDGFDVPYRVIHDLDEEGEGGANAAILESLGGNEDRRLTHDPNFEQQLFGQIWTKDKPWRATRAVGELDEISEQLIRFMTFALGCPVEDLQ